MSARDRLPSDATHESLCRRCGISCHLAIPINGIAVTVPGLHCKYLAEVARGRFECTVYPQRFELAPWCHHADEAAPLGYLARDCPYALRGGWRAGKVRPGAAAAATVWPLMLAELERDGVPDWIDRPALQCELDRREGAGVLALKALSGMPGRLALVRRRAAEEA